MNLPVFVRIQELRENLYPHRSARKTIGLVPTMGALHAGHATLIAAARAECEVVAVSIFVNPLQFGPNEDYGRYPRAFDSDLAICKEKGADVVFAPETTDIYPAPQFASVEVTRLTSHLCGAFRPGHFRGVATIVLKLFNIVQPDRAYFGEKDFQQLMVIRRMVQDLDVPLSVVGVPTVREHDGLALSSRNAYLSVEERKAAPALFQALEAARRLIENGETDATAIKEAAVGPLSRVPSLRVEYFEIVDLVELQPVASIGSPVRIASAVWVGKTRLIDNVGAAPKR